MKKEYRYEGLDGVFAHRPPTSSRVLLERDVSEWRPASPEEDGVLKELRSLRAMGSQELEHATGARLSGRDNPYEKDAAVLFYLIEKHGSRAVQAAVQCLVG